MGDPYARELPTMAHEVRGQLASDAIAEILGAFRVPTTDLSTLPKMKATIRPKEDRMDETATSDTAAPERGASYIRELKKAEREFELVCAEREILLDALVDSLPSVVGEVFRFTGSEAAREQLEFEVRRRARNLLSRRMRPEAQTQAEAIQKATHRAGL